MSEHMKEMRELLFQAKPIDFSKRPATLKLPQGKTYTLLLLSLPFLLFLGYEFLKDWNEGIVAYEYLALAALNLYWGFSHIKQLLSSYEITFSKDDVSFTKKRFFSIVEHWTTPLSQYQALELVSITGEKPIESLFSVNLVHPDPRKSLPLAASHQETIVRGRLDQLKIALSLPVIDKVAAHPKFSRAEKKATQSFWTRPVAVILLLMVVMPVGLLSWYGWVLAMSPMETVQCTIVAHEVTEAEEPQPDGRNTLLTTHYRYIYEGMSYESGSKIGHYQNREKMQRWLSKRPEGSQTDCHVDSRDPNRVLEYPFSKSLFYMPIYMGIGLPLIGALLILWTQFPLGFKSGPKTTFERVTRGNIKNKIKKRYRASILELKGIEFQGYCFYTEIATAFSIFSAFLTFLMMLSKKEVLNVRFPLRIATSYPLLTLPDQGTYAVVYALETRFLTLFTDGTMLITGTEGRIPSYAEETEKVYRQGVTQSIELAWEQHQIRVDAFRHEGKEIRSETRFQDYTEMLTRNEKVILDNHLFQGA